MNQKNMTRIGLAGSRFKLHEKAKDNLKECSDKMEKFLIESFIEHEWERRWFWQRWFGKPLTEEQSRVYLWKNNIQ